MVRRRRRCRESLPLPPDAVSPCQSHQVAWSLWVLGRKSVTFKLIRSSWFLWFLGGGGFCAGDAGSSIPSLFSVRTFLARGLAGSGWRGGASRSGAGGRGSVTGQARPGQAGSSLDRHPRCSPTRILCHGLKAVIVIPSSGRNSKVLALVQPCPAEPGCSVASSSLWSQLT